MQAAWQPRGFNPVYGFDEGAAPPNMMPQGQPPFLSQACYPGPPPQANQFQYQMPVNYPPMVINGRNPLYGGLINMPGMTFPAGGNPPDNGIPGCHLRNHTGGVGLPTGYDYLYPREHVKIHVFKTKDKPWQINPPSADLTTHVKLFVPCTVTTMELMKQLGCNNTDASKNILYECVEKGPNPSDPRRGNWATGLKIRGDDKDRMQKPIKEYGWDRSRTGHPGEKPIVWLWVTSDGE